MLSWRFLTASLVGFLLCMTSTSVYSAPICELDANSVPESCPATKAYSAFGAPPAGQCPEGSRPELLCVDPLPPAGIVCRPEDSMLMCFAEPKGLLVSLSYSWSSSNPNVYFGGSGEDVWLSCSVDANALITVVVSDVYGRSTTAQELVYCRKPRNGTVPR